MRRAYASASCSRIGSKQCGGIVRRLMHGRTDERTYEEHHSPTATTSRSVTCVRVQNDEEKGLVDR